MPANRTSIPNPLQAARPPLVGIEIGGTKLQIVLAEEPMQITRRWRATADRAGGGAAIQRQIADGLQTLLQGQSPRAIGVGFGGPVDVAAGRIRRSHQIAGWEGFPLRDWIGDLISAPVAVENDSNAAALAEAVYGAGKTRDLVFYCNFGSGVGGGFVAGGSIYHGISPGEMEFGHLRVDINDPHRTVESECSGWAIDRQLRQAGDENPDSALARILGISIGGIGGSGGIGGEARHLGSLVAAGDPHTKQVFDNLCRQIAFSLSHVVHLLHPGVIVIGGGLAMVGEPLRSAVAAALPGFVMEAFHPTPDVRLAALGEDPVPIGALELAARIATI
ncbi:ROK family protein [Humisphaera borealis]|uniref:ROK family protein n=1 Tax=Humisphaera borealis TaxID=2807512 RepID=A0A7M2WWL4_9BACT|nr:ROK family protein [Humisphaera borealis]QOV89592.1 ROK family protein [Humisphaera borealis]